MRNQEFDKVRKALGHLSLEGPTELGVSIIGRQTSYFDHPRAYKLKTGEILFVVSNYGDRNGKKLVDLGMFPMPQVYHHNAASYGMLVRNKTELQEFINSVSAI